MPIVKLPNGKTKEFPYTKEGKKKAKKYAEKMGGEVRDKYGYMGRTDYSSKKKMKKKKK
jgi:uncharacterized protein with GYD domain